MDESPNLDATVDLSSGGRVQKILVQFEAAWREALQGFPPPRIDAYIVHANEEEKAYLEARLSDIARDYERRLIEERNRPAREVATIPDSDGPARIEPAVASVAGKNVTADLGATVALEGATP